MEIISSTTRDINHTIALTGFLLCFYGLLQVMLTSSVEQKGKLVGFKIYTCLALFDAASLISFMFAGRQGPKWHVVLQISKFMEFFLVTLLILNAARLIGFHIGDEDQSERRFSVLNICILLQTLLLTVNLFTGFVYRIGPDNVYRTGAAYPVAYIIPITMVCIVFSFRASNGKNMNKLQIIAFDMSFLLIILAGIIQTKYVGLFIGVLVAILATSAFYILMLEDQREKYNKKLEESYLMRSNLLAGQLKPHFLSNTLAMIRTMCEPDSDAFAAISKLSEFIRGSLKVVTETKPIPIEEELELIEDYIDLQNLRFKNSVNVEWDIEETEFSVPALSVQILVENAIKHGIRETPEGRGVIGIGTGSDEDTYYVRISDNGVGFDADTEEWGTGLRNLRDRLDIMCGGKLEIDSRHGIGTVGIVRIPKEREE